MTDKLQKIISEYTKENYENFMSYLKDENTSSNELINSKNEILELAKKLYNINNTVEALNILIYYYNKCKDKEIRNFIFDFYYKPFITKYKETYEKNVNVFKQYKYLKNKNFLNFDELNLYFIPYQKELDINKTTFAVYNKSKDEFIPIYILKLLMPPGTDLSLKGKIILLNDVYDTDFIFNISDKTDDTNNFLKIFNLKTQLYLYYNSFIDFINYLQLFDWEIILKLNNVIFIYGRNDIQTFFIDSTLKLPDLHISSPNSEEKQIGDLFKWLYFQRNNKLLEYEKELTIYYKNLNPSDILKKIKNKTVKIAIISSAFTSALQYYSRDCFEALKNLNIEAKLIIEENNLTHDYIYWYKKNYCEFKPDIIIVCDYFRDKIIAPENSIFVSWIIDFLPHFFSNQEVSKLKDIDFILNLFYSDEELIKIGYNPQQMIDAPISINLNLYKKYTLTTNEIDNYSCDICIISNTGDIDLSLNGFCNIFNIENFKTDFKVLVDKIYNDMYNESKTYYDLKELNKSINDIFINKKCFLNNEVLQQISYNFKADVISTIHKLVNIIWLHENNYNINLWGRPWANHPILKKYSKGIAQNGETMSKILNASKISIGLNNVITLHPRALEALMSNSFYIGNNIPENFDCANVRKFLKENEEIVLFYNREDLYKKIDYYLQNESERKRIIKNSQRVIREKLTFETLMKNMLNKIQQRLS